MAENYDDLRDTLLVNAVGSGKGSGPTATLVFVEGPNSGSVASLDRDRTVVGRRHTADLVLGSRAVSKEHCVIVREGHAFFIEDSGSTNGVFVNGTRLAAHARRRLIHGDSVRLADTLALYRESGCFKDVTGASRIVIDRAKVAQEAADALAEFDGWAQRGPRATG